MSSEVAVTESEFLQIKQAAMVNPQLRQCRDIKDVYLTLAAAGLEGEKARILGEFTAAVNAQKKGQQ